MNILNVYFVEISFSFTLILTFFFQILPPKPPQKIQDKYFCYLQQMSNESWGIFQKLPVFLPIVLGFFLSAGNLVFVPCIASEISLPVSSQAPPTPLFPGTNGPRRESGFNPGQLLQP